MFKFLEVPIFYYFPLFNSIIICYVLFINSPFSNHHYSKIFNRAYPSKSVFSPIFSNRIVAFRSPEAVDILITLPIPNRACSTRIPVSNPVVSLGVKFTEGAMDTFLIDGFLEMGLKLLEIPENDLLTVFKPFPFKKLFLVRDLDLKYGSKLPDEWDDKLKLLLAWKERLLAVTCSKYFESISFRKRLGCAWVSCPHL